MKFASNEAQIARPSILAVRYEYRIPRATFVVGNSWHSCAFSCFPVTPPSLIISLISSNNNNPICHLCIIIPLFLSPFQLFNIFFSFVWNVSCSNSVVSFLVYSMFVILKHKNTFIIKVRLMDSVIFLKIINLVVIIIQTSDIKITFWCNMVLVSSSLY